MDLQLSMQSVYITTDVGFESRSGRGVQHNMIKFVSDMQHDGTWFSAGTLVSSTNKTDHHDITEMLLKVALNIIKQTNKQTNKPVTNRR
jgi:hypothetical protein